jgi:hypothetical protein
MAPKLSIDYRIFKAQHTEESCKLRAFFIPPIRWDQKHPVATCEEPYWKIDLRALLTEGARGWVDYSSDRVVRRRPELNATPELNEIRCGAE